MTPFRLSTLTLLLCSLLALPAVAQDEPGVPEAPAAEPAPPAGAAPADPLAAARAACGDRSRPCPHFAELLRHAHDPQHGPEAVTLLGGLGDARAASTLARVAVYGQTDALRKAAQQALQALARSGAGGRAAVAQIAKSDADPTVRAQAQLVAGADEAPPSSPARVEAGPAAPPAPVRKRSKQQRRVIYGATALPEEPGAVTWTVYNIAYHTLDYAVSEHLELGIGTIVPIAVWGVVPRARLMFSPHEDVHLGLQAMVPFFGVFVEDVGGAVLFGGGPILTVGDEDLMLNVSALFGAIKTFGKDFLDDANAEGGMLPSIGASWQVHRAIRLNLEVYAPIAFSATEEAGKIWLLLYGLRITGENIFGDISFALPIFEDVDELLKYMPIGYPLLSFGYNWH